MGGPCKGVCDGDAPSLAPLGVRIYHYATGRGRPPADPDTGQRPAAGSYGPWSRCRACQIYLTWEGRDCPCCGQRLRKRTPSARAYQGQCRHQAAMAIKESRDNDDGAVPLAPLVAVPDKRRRIA